MRKIFQKWSLGGVLGLILLSVSVSTSCMQGKGQGQADAQTKTAQVAKEQRSADGLRLMSMLSEQDFENALSLLDTLHARYPDDPQFYFAEGWIYDMEDDSIKSRRCFEKALTLYDSLVIQDDGVDGKINRAFIIQILYGEDAYNEEITKIAQSARTPEDSANIENWRGVLYDKDEKDIFNLHVYINESIDNVP